MSQTMFYKMSSYLYVFVFFDEMDAIFENFIKESF